LCSYDHRIVKISKLIKKIKTLFIGGLPIFSQEQNWHKILVSPEKYAPSRRRVTDCCFNEMKRKDLFVVSLKKQIPGKTPMQVKKAEEHTHVQSVLARSGPEENSDILNV
jgi:hypothetical protein